jgi:hypothetical protein
MDEQKLGEAIGRSMSEVTAKMMPEMAETMTRSVLAAQTGVYVEVTPTELTQKLSDRAKRLRACVEEIAAAPIDPSDLAEIPPYMRAARENEAGVREQNERAVRQEQQRRRTQIESLRTEAERLDFIAAHLPTDRQTIRMDRHELDDLLFGERRGASTYL